MGPCCHQLPPWQLAWVLHPLTFCRGSRRGSTAMRSAVKLASLRYGSTFFTHSTSICKRR